MRYRVYGRIAVAGNQLVTVVLVLHLSLLEVGGQSHVVMRRQDQAGALPLQPHAMRVNLLLGRLLLRHQVIEAEHHQGVGVVQDPLVNRAA